MKSRMISRLWLAGLLLWIIGLFQTAAFAEAIRPTAYYARFTLTSHNGMIVASKLELLPTETEYRTEGFQCVRTTGIADSNASLDMGSSARHDGIVRILTAHGLKSVCGRGYLWNAHGDDQVQMNYEGVFRYPFRIVGEDFKNDTYRLNLEIEFSPLAFPDQWSYLSLKNEIHKAAAWVWAFFV